MLEVPINYLAVVIAAVASMALGALWYGPLFGKQWVSLMGMSQEKLDEAKSRGTGKLYVIAFFGSLVMSYVLAHSLFFASMYLVTVGATAGIMAGVWNWFGFVAPVTLGSVLWENKPWKLWFLNNSYYLVSLMVMGVILSVWQ